MVYKHQEGNKRVKTILFLLAIVGLLYSADHCVRPGATGTGSGEDWTNAYEALPAVLVRGDTYYLADGTYPSYTFNDAVSGTSVISVVKASITSHGTSTGWDDAYGDGEAVMYPMYITTGYHTIDGAYRTSKSSGYGIRVIVNGQSAPTTQEHGITTSNVAGITIKYINFDGDSITYPGFTDSYAVKNGYEQVAGGSNLYIGYCYFHHFVGPMSRTRNLSGVIFEHNYYHDNRSIAAVHGDAIQAWGTSNYATSFENSVIRYCEFNDIEGTAVINLAWGIKNMHIYGCLTTQTSIDTGTGLGFASPYDGPVENLYIYNNTFANVSVDKMYMVVQADGTVVDSSAFAFNNLWYNCTPSNCVGINGFHEENNILINSSKLFNYTPDASSQVITNGDSPFIDSTSNFQLSSELAGKALSGEIWWNITYDSGDDVLGTVYGSDGVWDVGAFEFEAGGNPVTPTKRGYGWLR